MSCFYADQLGNVHRTSTAHPNHEIATFLLENLRTIEDVCLNRVTVNPIKNCIANLSGLKSLSYFVGEPGFSVINATRPPK